MKTNQNPTASNQAIVRSIIGVDVKDLMSYPMVGRFGNKFWANGNEFSHVQTRVFIPLPEGGVRELTDIIGVSVVTLSNGGVVKSHYGKIRREDVPSDAIVAQFQCDNFDGEVRQGWVVCPIEYVGD